MKIKRLVLMLTFAVGSIMFLSGQSDDLFSIGPRGGVNFSNVTNVDGSESVVGAVVGLTMTHSFNERTGLTVDALYSEEGFKTSFDDYTLRYVQIPVYADFFGGELGNAFRPKAYLGLAPSFFVGGKNNGVDVDKDNFSKVLFSLSGGLGFNLRVASRIWLNTDVRAFVGMSDIRANEFEQGEPVKYRTVQTTLGLAYGLSRI